MLKQHGNSLFVTSLDKGTSMRVYPLPVWELIEAGLGSLPQLDPKKRNFLRMANYFGGEVELDRTGRLLVPMELRGTTVSRGPVKVVGMGSYLEIWDPERFLETSELLSDSELEALGI